MEHPTDVYDVTFADGVIKKCYIYTVDFEGSNAYTVVDIETLLGETFNDSRLFIDEEHKSAICTKPSLALVIENLTYNYFQNSNLSAWKVWYCLDNDKTRFAWADDSVDVSIPAKIKTIGGRNYTFPDTTFIRDEQNDEIGNGGEETFYAWVKDDDGSTIAYTISNPPLVTSHLYIKGSSGFEEVANKVDVYTPAHEGTNLPNGRGVIYRLIDEWNNDVPYDFKNIQFYVDGRYFYAIVDLEAGNDDPTLDGVRVKKLYLLSNYNSKLYRIISNRLSQKPAINIIFLNNSAVYEGDGYTIVRDGRNLV